MKPAIQVWEFYDAPEHLRALSDNGGDEDWLALVPLEFGERPGDTNSEGIPYIGWLQDGGSFGCCNVTKVRTAEGFVFIGAHS